MSDPDFLHQETHHYFNVQGFVPAKSDEIPRGQSISVKIETNENGLALDGEIDEIHGLYAISVVSVAIDQSRFD